MARNRALFATTSRTPPATYQRQHQRQHQRQRRDRNTSSYKWSQQSSITHGCGQSYPWEDCAQRVVCDAEVDLCFTVCNGSGAYQASESTEGVDKTDTRAQWPAGIRREQCK
jgi:hypothetical protein